jgi:hypothetical protein
VSSVGYLKRSEGRAEWFVPVQAFQPCGWQDWPFVEAQVILDLPPAVVPEVPEVYLVPPPASKVGRTLPLFASDFGGDV